MHYADLDHIGFSVSNLDRSSDWYTFFLNQAPILRKTWDVEYVGRIVGYPKVKMEAAFWRLPGGTVLELLEYQNPRARRVDMETYNAGNAHLCLVVANLEADFERLRERVVFRHPEPVEIPWGPYMGGKACYLRDPDGISIELIELPPGGPRFDEHEIPAEG
jgi:catechol 2,3-dioxygenase-like lactoylglutathione lyase family enzyme